MRRLVLAALAAGCSSPSPGGTGTVIYCEATKGFIVVVDVASGTQTPVDTGSFGAVAIAPDRQHVAYMATDQIPRIADLQTGHITVLASTDQCGSSLTWGPGNTLTYCIGATDTLQTGFLPGIGATVRVVDSFLVATSSDGARIAYVHRPDPDNSPSGDLFVEEGDGANPRMLLSGATVLNYAFLPDDSGLVIEDILDPTTAATHLATLSFADGVRVERGPGALVAAAPHGSRFSPDGREVLAIVNSELVALDLASGATRPFASVNPNTFAGGAFVAADRVIFWSQSDFAPNGDLQSSVHLAGLDDETTLVSSNGSQRCELDDVSVEQGLAAIACAVPAMIDFTGKLVTSHDALLVLGVSGDGAGMVTVATDGTVEFAGIDGSVRTLGQAVPESETHRIPPYAAYAP